MSNHLTCTDHKRRVMVLESESVIHRSDSSVCKTKSVKAGEFFYTPEHVVALDHQSRSNRP